MQRITNVSQPTAEAQALLDTVQKKLGKIPNLFRSLGNSAAALRGYLELNTALSSGVLDISLREQIAIATAGQNDCNYCASAHTALGKKAGIDIQELSLNLNARSEDQKTAAVLSFVKKVIELRGSIRDSDLINLRQVGLNDAEIVEVIAHIGMNTFTNYFNNVAETQIDFPLVDTKAS